MASVDPDWDFKGEVSHLSRDAGLHKYLFDIIFPHSGTEPQARSTGNIAIEKLKWVLPP